MGLRVHTVHSANINELIERYPCLKCLKSMRVPKDGMHTWKINNSYFRYSNQEGYAIQVMFIGKTGYGKSTTLNQIVGKEVFETSDVSACTKDLYEALYKTSPFDSTFFSLGDLPGVGESHYADDHYYTWYKEMLRKSDVVVYVLRADQRDFAVDEMIFKNLFSSDDKKKVILALNYADKIEPVNRKRGLTSEQLYSLQRKVYEVSRIFEMPRSNILYYSAVEKINLNLLVERISDKIGSKFL